MTFSIGSHAPMAAFAGIAKHQPVRLLTDFPRVHHGAIASRAMGSFASHVTALGMNPVAFMGGMGSAASTIAVNADALTAPAMVTMLLLALQYCAQPPITRKFLDSRTNKKGVTMVEEIVKIALSAFFFFSCGKDAVSTALQGWTLSSSLLLAGFPALLYAIQGVLTYIGYQNTDSVTFNGLNQTKTLSAALWCFLLMGKRQSVIQMVALAILLFSAMLFQGSISFSGLFSKRSDDKDGDVSGVAKVDESRAKTSISKGILPCLAAAFISGLAGALSQKGVQMAGGRGRNPYLYTMELGLYSSISLLISLVTTKDGRESLKGENGIFKHWTVFSIIPVAVRSFGGILTALVHKHAGATRKGFALILGLVLTGVTQSWIEGEKLSGDELTAMVLVILSSYLHLMYPPMAV